MTHPNATSIFTVAPVKDDRRAAVLGRLQRLEGFLREDPSNDRLLVDAFETALSCGEWERAHFHLRRGQVLDVESFAWRLREGDFWLAQQRYDDALHVLKPLQELSHPPAGFKEVLLHNLAFIEHRQGRHAGCIALLAPVLESAVAASADSAPGTVMPRLVAMRALQQLWLRALHHDGQLDRAMAWGRAAETQQVLDRQASGVASLIAIDASDFAAAHRWSSLSLSHDAPEDHPVEALVAQASLALAARDARSAKHLAQVALQRRPGDGRAWSTYAFAALLDGDLTTARDAFEKAVASLASHIGTWHGLGWTQILQKDFPGAQASFETALALDRNFSESHGGLAVVLAMQSLRPQAQAHVERALRLDGGNLSGRYAQALLSGGVKDVADLQRLAQRLLGGKKGALGEDLAGLFGPPTAGSSDRSQP